ncbi:MAG: hypothetical protein JSV86_08770 [Gemmatimonadota bacterium]|nr:MAG: hypothetical protein JSV86_08770 [Gemmatimonadota bacterium]
MTASYAASRNMLDRLLALAGLVIVVVEIYALVDAPLHALLLAFGVLLIYVGTWRFVGRLLHRRMNRVLREQIDTFISLARDLYTHRTNGDSARFLETKAALRDTTERIISAASSYQEQPEE